MELCDANPVRGVKPTCDDRDYVVLDDAEYGRLLAECTKSGPMLGLYALVLGEAELRCEPDCLWLQWDDLKLDDGLLWVANGRDGHRVKGGR